MSDSVHRVESVVPMRVGSQLGSRLAGAALALAAMVGVMASCSRASEPSASGDGPRTAPVSVVATIGMVADVAREVGQDRVRVTGLMGEGVDPHLYKASPGDVRAMSDADIILYNGLHLEGRMADIIVRMASRTTVVQVTETIDPNRLREPPEFDGHYDPHVWFDASLWQSAVTRIRDVLIQEDPSEKDAYTAAASEYSALLADVHAYAKATIATIPASSRVLVTAHDAFGYFGDAYGLEVMAIQGISTDSEASLQDINALVDALVARKVPAVFVESTVPRKTIDALIEGAKGRGHSLTIGGELFSDAMGPEGTLEGTYVGMMLHNVDAITRALGGTVPPTKPARIAAYVARFDARANDSAAGSPASKDP